MTTNGSDYAAWIGHSVVDAEGGKIGKVSQIYVDDQTGLPTWLSVKTGLFGNSSSFVPLANATADGDTLVVPFDKDQIKAAPAVDDDADGHLEVSEEQALYDHYGQSYVAGGVVPARNDEEVSPGLATDDAMTRSEEEIRVGTRVEEKGRVRLRKYIVTENVTMTVPVSHEEVRIERVPISDADGSATAEDPTISEEEHEIVLHREVPVVEKTVVAKERVRLTTEQVAGETQVAGEVRKERIEADGLDDGEGLSVASAPPE